MLSSNNNISSKVTTKKNKNNKNNKKLDNRGYSTTSDIKKSISPNNTINNITNDNDNIIIGNARKCILCIRGHVDTGKTSFVSILSSHSKKSARSSSIINNEAGGITQQVGTTTFNRDHIIQFIPTHLQDKFNMSFVTIDTPGHASFENIRRIGTSIAHITLIFVDITTGFDIDTLNFLQNNIKTIFDFDKTIIVLNKIDKIFSYNSIGFGNIMKVFKNQSESVINQIEEYYSVLIRQLSSIELYGEPYYRKKSRECLTMIPISARCGDGIPDLLLYMSNSRINLDIYNDENFEDTKECKNSVIKSNSSPNIGYIIDKRIDPTFGKIIIGIMKYGSITRSNSIQINGSIFNIRNLLHSSNNHDSREHSFEPINEINDAESFAFKVESEFYDLIELGAEFTPIIGNKIGKTIIDNFTIEKAFNRKEKFLKDKGVHVIIPSESMIEGLYDHFNTNNIPISNYSIGTISKTDLMIFINKMTDNTNILDRYKVILICIPDISIIDTTLQQIISRYFDESMIASIHLNNIKIIFSGTIYRLVDELNIYINICRRQFIEKYGDAVPFTAKIIPKFIFRTKNPIICGVHIISGLIHVGSIICDNTGKEYGIIQSIQLDGKNITLGNKDSDICINILGEQSIDKTIEYIFCNKSKYPENICKLLSEDIKIIHNIDNPNIVNDNKSSKKTKLKKGKK